VDHGICTVNAVRLRLAGAESLDGALAGATGLGGSQLTYVAIREGTPVP